MAKEMETSVKITLIIAGTILILAAVMGIGMWAFLGWANAETINVDGIAVVKANPDVVSVYFNVETKGEDAQKAKDANSEIVEKVIAGLEGIGIAKSEISTESFNIYEDCNWINGAQRCSGWKAVHGMKVKLDSSRIGEIGKVIDAGVDNGAIVTYINFELSRELENSYKSEALKKAGEDARIKADSIASGLGKKVSGIKSITTPNFDYYPWRLYAAEDSAAGMSGSGVAEAKLAATNIQPGEREISGSVSVVFYIK